MKRMIFAVLLLAAPAFAQGEIGEPPRPPPEEPASSGHDGLTLELNVLGVNSIGSILNLGSVSTAASSLNPSAAIGYVFGKNAVLVNVGLLGFGPGTNVAFSINPLFRHYFSPLTTGAVSLFAEGGLSFGFLSPASGNANYLIGLFGGAGAEWLFVKNIGLIVDLLAEYGHAHTTSSGFNGGDSNVDAIGFAGNVGVTVHW